MNEMTDAEKAKKLEQALQATFGPGTNLNQQIEQIEKVADSARQLHTEVARVDLANRLAETWVPNWLADVIAAWMPEVMLPDLKLIIMPALPVEAEPVEESEVMD